MLLPTVVTVALLLMLLSTVHNDRQWAGHEPTDQSYTAAWRVPKDGSSSWHAPAPPNLPNLLQHPACLFSIVAGVLLLTGTGGHGGRQVGLAAGHAMAAC